MRKSISIISFLFSIGLYGQQESLVTQFAYNKLSLNPAYAGSEDSFSVGLSIRDQWNGLTGAPAFQQLYVDLPLIKQNLGLGFNVSNESVGIENRTGIRGSYAYFVRTDKSIFQLGMSVSYKNLTKDFSDDRINALDGIGADPIIGTGSQSFHLFNVGLGVYFRQAGYYLGASVPNLLENSVSDFDASTQRTLHFMFGKEQVVSTSLILFPEVMVSIAEGVPAAVNLQLRSLVQQHYMIGVNYRSNNMGFGESLGLLLGFKANQQFTLGVAYDFNAANFKRDTNGSIELFARYHFGETSSKRKIINPRYF